MKVYKDIASLPVFNKAVITTGSFDGVHKGHKLVLDQLLKEATAIGGTAVIITFDPHPKQIVRVNDQPVKILNTPAEKYELLRENGIEHIVVVPFDKAFADLSADQYIHDFLVKHFHPALIVVGYDHRFGNNREGNFEQLKAAGKENDFEVKEIPEHVVKDVTISSTKIRDAIGNGNFKVAAEYLGYDYFFSGKVVEGNKLGRTIGYPTANLQMENENKLVPANGVYAVDVQLEERALKGMMNIGIRPTIGGTQRVTEVNLFDFDEDIYGRILKITLKQSLRSEVKFGGLDELKAQLGRDKEDAIRLNP